MLGSRISSFTGSNKMLGILCNVILAKRLVLNTFYFLYDREE